MTQTNFEYAKTLSPAKRDELYEETLATFRQTSCCPLSSFSFWLNTPRREKRFLTAINVLKNAKITAQQQVQFENVKHDGLYSSVLLAGLNEKNREIDDAINTLEALEGEK